MMNSYHFLLLLILTGCHYQTPQNPFNTESNYYKAMNSNLVGADRVAAAKKLNEVEREYLIASLFARLESTDEDTPNSAWIIGEVGDSNALPHLIKLLKANDNMPDQYNTAIWVAINKIDSRKE